MDVTSQVGRGTWLDTSAHRAWIRLSFPLSISDIWQIWAIFDKNVQAASRNKAQIQGDLFAFPPTRQALAREETELGTLPHRFFLNSAEGNRHSLKKAARGNPQEATFDRMTKSLAKNQDGLVFQRLTKKSKPDDEEIFERLTKRDNDEAVFERLTKRGSADDDEAGFMRITKKNDHNNDETGFMRITKKNDHNDDETGFMRITKKNDHDEIAHYILYSYLPFQKMTYAGLRPLTNVGLI